MNILIIGGFGMKPSDGSKYWSLWNQFTAAGHKVICRSWDSNDVEADLLWADAVVAYSYGVAAFKKRIGDIVDPGWWRKSKWPEGKRYKAVVFIAGVPRAWWCQFGFFNLIWEMPEFVDHGLCMQVDAFPESYTLKNDDAVGLFWEDRGEIPHWARTVNIDCNALVRNLNAVKKHTDIKDMPVVLDFVAEYVLSKVSERDLKEAA